MLKTKNLPEGPCPIDRLPHLHSLGPTSVWKDTLCRVSADDASPSRSIHKVTSLNCEARDQNFGFCLSPLKNIKDRSGLPMVGSLKT